MDKKLFYGLKQILNYDELNISARKLKRKTENNQIIPRGLSSGQVYNYLQDKIEKYISYIRKTHW